MKGKGRLAKAWRDPKKRRRILIATAIPTFALVVLATLMGAGLVEFPRLERALGIGGGEPAAAGSVIVTSPVEGDTVATGDRIEGEKEGNGIVNVWVKGVNYAVPVDMDGDSWGYTYQGGLDGRETLVFSLVDGGSWGAETEVAFTFGQTAPADEVDDGPATESTDTKRSIFTPIAKFVRGVVSVVTHAFGNGADAATGEGTGDLDGNGVPDRWQGGPVSPSGGWYARIPYANSIITVLGLGVVAVALVYAIRAKWIHSFLLQRRSLRLREAAQKQSATERELRIRERAQARQLGVMAKLGAKKVDAVAGLQREQIRAQRALASEQLRAQRSVAERKLGLVGENLRARKDLASKTLDARVKVEESRSWKDRLLGGGQRGV